MSTGECREGMAALTQLRIMSDRYKNGAIGFVPLLLIGMVASACGFPAWRDQALREVAEGRWHVNPEQVPPGSAPSQTIEFFDAGGRHLGYGKVQGGTVEFFNADSSRAGFGRLGR